MRRKNRNIHRKAAQSSNQKDPFRMVRIGDKCVTLEMPILLDEDIQRYVIREHGRQPTVD